MLGEAHADESEYSRDFYDADRPLIDCSRDKSGSAVLCTDEVKDSVSDEYTFQFDDVLSEYSTVEEKTCSSVNQKLADGVNVMFKKGMQLEKYKDKIGQIDRPENCTGLTNVEVEEIIWNLLQPQTKNFDKRLQVIQNAMAKSACCITQMLDVIQKQCIDKTTAESDIVKLKTELARHGTSSLALLGHAFHNLCLRRRELQKPDVAWKYGSIFNTDVEHNRWLYGGKAQVEEMIKEIGTTNKVAREMKPNFKYHNRGSYGYASRFTPYPKPAAGSMRQRGSFGRGNRPGRFMNFGRGGGRAGNHPSRGSVRSRVKTAPYFSRGEVSSKTKLSLYNHNNVNAMKAESIPFQAGRIRHYFKNWQNITSDHEILQTVSGATIEFANRTTESETVVQFTQPISKFNAMQTEIVQNEIMDLQSKQVIEEVEHEEGEFISSIFLIPKRNGKYRLILNLKKFNQQVEYFHFKMETFDMAIKMMSPDCYLASIDLKDAYYSVPIHEQFRKYLRFIWNGALWQFCCLPNGLACGPRKFTKLLKPVYATLRQEGHIVSGFLDDMLLVADSEAELRAL